MFSFKAEFPQQMNTDTHRKVSLGINDSLKVGIAQQFARDFDHFSKELDGDCMMDFKRSSFKKRDRLSGNGAKALEHDCAQSKGGLKAGPISRSAVTSPKIRILIDCTPKSLLRGRGTQGVEAYRLQISDKIPYRGWAYKREFLPNMRAGQLERLQSSAGRVRPGMLRPSSAPLMKQMEEVGARAQQKANNSKDDGGTEKMTGENDWLVMEVIAAMSRAQQSRELHRLFRFKKHFGVSHLTNELLRPRFLGDLRISRKAFVDLLYPMSPESFENSQRVAAAVFDAVSIAPSAEGSFTKDVLTVMAFVEDNGSFVATLVKIIDDRKFNAQPFVSATHFRLMERLLTHEVDKTWVQRILKEFEKAQDKESLASGKKSSSKRRVQFEWYQFSLMISQIDEKAWLSWTQKGEM